jgi:hypothetical protein
MNRYLTAAVICLAIYAAWLTGFTANHLKDRFCASSILDDSEPKPTQPREVAQHAPALPPTVTVAQLKEVWPTHEQDGLTIAQILNQTNGE